MGPVIGVDLPAARMVGTAALAHRRPRRRWYGIHCTSDAACDHPDAKHGEPRQTQMARRVRCWHLDSGFGLRRPG